MPVDRHTTLRRAEQYLLQGKHALAIDEYLRVLEDQPRDWATTNTLGDLYVRDRQHARAVEQFVRSADGLFADGFITRAAALYRKALRFDPGHTHALVRLAEAASAQGLMADACTYLQQAIEASRARDDVEAVGRLEGALAVLERRGSRHMDRPVEPATVPDPGVRPVPLNPHAVHIDEVDAVPDVGIEIVGLEAPSEVPVPALEDVFAGFREDLAVEESGGATAALARGLTLHAAGQIDASIPDLEWAARAPQLRFEAASCLARLHRDRGQLAGAVEWFERAAEAAAPSEAEAHRLLYDLAGALEAAGEAARALAVYLELQIAAGPYLDVAERVNRLAVVESGE